MSPIFSSILQILTGGISKYFTSGTSVLQGIGDSFSKVLEPLSTLGQNHTDNLLASWTGSRLTDAQREQNEWNKQETLSAWNRQMEASNTYYQRQVKDLQAAGLNPMLATGGSPSVPSASVANGVSPGAGTLGLDSIMNIFRLNSELKNIDADTSKKLADAGKAASETKGIDIVNQYEDERQRLELEGRGLSNSLTRIQIGQINKSLEDIDSQIALRVEQAKSEKERRDLMSAQALSARANVYQVAELLPYSKALMDAQTEQARSNAAYAAAQAAYKNGLLTSGMIEATVSKTLYDAKQSKESANYTKIKAAAANIEKSLREGRNPENWSPDGPEGAIIGTLYNFLEMINPLSKLAIGL